MSGDERRRTSAEEEERVVAEVLRDLDGVPGGGPGDPARVPVEEAGGGVAEGYEQAEEALIEHASEADPAGSDRVLEDAGEPEPDEDRATYGEPDEGRVRDGADPTREERPPVE